MAALISSVMEHQGQGPVLRRALRGDGDRDPAAGRQPLRPRVRRRRGQHPLRPRRRQGRRLPGRRGDQGARARTAARSTSLWDFCERVDAARVNKKAIEALIKCGAFGSTGATRKGMLAVLEQAQARGPEGAAGRADRPGLDLRPGRARRRAATGAAAAFAARRHPPIPLEEFDQPELLAVEKESIGLFISAHPLKEVREALRAAGRLLARRARRAPRRRLGDGRRDHHAGQADPDAQRRPR